ncbi:MAG: holo-ACP synthase [Proteobacteria bacterium]|nr:holo-ACP synthase [Pseudomonadota bacterium]MDA1135541.1 holo-ACP synthase [Pseudomonadota bacterium]
MIYGVGTDILDASRISNILKKFDKKFISRIYGKNEISFLNKKLKNQNLFLSKRFAAKEAFWKAMSPQRGDGLLFTEIEVLNDKNGKPYFYFSGKTEEYIKKKEEGLHGNLKFDISLSDEPPYVIAFVVISLALIG